MSVERVLARHPDRAHTKPMHKPAVILLTDLLKVCMVSTGYTDCSSALLELNSSSGWKYNARHLMR